MNGLIPSLQPLPDSRRLIALERGINLRDFGGYPTETGRYVREAMLYRSGTMAYTHEEDRQALRELGLAAIVDLRRDSERSLEPADWHDGLDVDYWRRDYKESSGILKTGSSMFDASSAEAIAAMTDVYRAIPYDHAPSFAELFRKLAAGRVPLLVHCAAGKDRTGVAAALVLEALQVPRKLVVEDYLITNRHIDFGKLFAMRQKSELFARAMKKPSRPLFDADTRYIKAMFEQIERRHGSVAKYLADVLEVRLFDIAAIRESLTVEVSATVA
jgi:protein-tyrosine phosphatase